MHSARCGPAGICPVDSTRNPDTMTPAERDAEVASILALGLVRAIRMARARIGSGPSASIQKVSESLSIQLEAVPHAGLSVTERPAG